AVEQIAELRNRGGADTAGTQQNPCHQNQDDGSVSFHAFGLPATVDSIPKRRFYPKPNLSQSRAGDNGSMVSDKPNATTNGADRTTAPMVFRGRVVLPDTI